MGFAMSEQERGVVTVIRLAGELDMASAPSLQTTVDELVSLGHCRIVLDLTELTFCDSAGLNAFIRGDRRCQPHGGWLRLQHAGGHVARVIRLSGIDHLLTYHGDD